MPIQSSLYLRFPQKEVMELDLNPEVSTEGKEVPESNKVDPEFLPFAEMPQVEELEVMDIVSEAANVSFDGSACLSDKERHNVIELSCKTTLADILPSFGIGAVETFEFPN